VTLRVLLVLAAFFATVGLAQAQETFDTGGHSRGETHVFDSVYIAPDEIVDGDLNVVFGDAEVAGVVRGDCNAVFGTCKIDDTGRVLGRVNSVTNDGMRAFFPWIVRRDLANPFVEQDHRLLLKLASSAIVVLVFLLFPMRMRVALDRVERHPGLATAAGAIAAVAIVPIGILLLVSVIGIPLIVLEIAAVLVCVWLGTGAIALLVGRRLCELVMPTATPSPLVALILGLVVISAAEIVPVLGWAVGALIWLAGLGAAILSFIRAAALDSAVHRAPVGGPPVSRW
jgi:hypothetical protein